MSGAEGKIRLRLPDHYNRSVDEGVWDELEKYIFTGFLTSSTVVAGRSFVFKTINPYELRNLEFMRPAKAPDADVRSKFRSAFIAYSVLMVDGVNTLFERPRHINRLVRAINKIPTAVQEEIIRNLSVLNERASRLHPLVEVYAYENRSRFRWMQIDNTQVHSPISTGIPGTDELGMNVAQQTWTALNRLIDRREVMEREWSNAKFIGSCFAGKAIRSVDEKDKSRLERERTDREELKMKLLHSYLNREALGKEPEETIELPDGRTATVVRGNAADGKWRADSAEELREQLERALSGELDHHDRIIEAQQKKLHERALRMEAEQNRVFQTPRVPGGPKEAGSMVLGGKDAADAYIKRMEDLAEAQRRKRLQVTLDQENSDKAANDEDTPVGG